MKNAYIVQGTGESTGCRFITDVLLKCGISGRSGHRQEFQDVMYDDAKFIQQAKDNNYDNLVVRQSWPHGSNLPSLYNWYNKLKKSGYDKVYTIITTRSQPAQIVSTLGSGHITSNPVSEYLSDPEKRIKSAWKYIFSDLIRIENGAYDDFVVVNLGNLSSHPYVNLRYVLESVNVNIPVDFDQSIVKAGIDTPRIDEYNSKYFLKVN